MRLKFCALMLAVLFACSAPLMAAVTMQSLVHGTTTTVLTLTSLTNNSRSSAGTAYDPRISGTGLGYLNVVVECVFTFAAAPTAGTAVNVWLLKSLDGTNFENTTTSRVPDVVCPVTPAQTGTRVSFHQLRLPSMRFQAIALNDGTGQTISSGTIAILPTTIQGN